MLRALVISVRVFALFLGLLAMLVVTVAFPGTAGAQTSKVVVPVEGKIIDGGTFAGKIVNPDFRYVNTDGYKGLKVSGILQGTVTKANGAERRSPKSSTPARRLARTPTGRRGRARSSSSTSGGSTSICSGWL